MKYNLLLLFSIFNFYPTSITAQKIEITLPREANKQYCFILNQGINSDTIQLGKLDTEGHTSITIPSEYKGYIGMGSMVIKSSEDFNMVIDKNNFSIKRDKVSNAVTTDSRENDYLYRYVLSAEKPTLDKSLYANSFIELITSLSQLNNILANPSNLKDRVAIKTYILNEMDFKKLYTSGFWYNTIDAIVKLSGDEATLSNDMIKILNRIDDQEVYEHLVNNLITITQQFELEKAFTTIISHVEDSNRIKYPQGDIYAAFLSLKLRPGMLSPSIEGLRKNKSSDYEKTLIAFYQPDCTNCKIEMQQLIDNNNALKDQKVRIISISADYSQESYEMDKENFPWDDKLCDLKGFAGSNFMNFGIIATPTFFLIDKNKNIIDKQGVFSKLQF